jgi:outer membrane receptor protein involved in Fe transport
MAKMRPLIVAGMLTCIVELAHAQSDTTTGRSEGVDVTVEAERAYTAASDKTVLATRFELAPKNSTQDLLRLVPGLVIAQHAGGGKAEQIFIRGFDADHGTDINISVDDAPVNMVSHGHGQGYADLHFIIPETIEAIDVVKGPYSARFGDLATAGAVVFRTKDRLNASTFKLEGGSFDTYRALATVADPIKSDGFSSYFAADIYGTRGYFESPQDMNRVNLFAKATSDMESGRLSASFMSFASGWQASGQIPQRAVERGELSRFGAVNDNEGGTTSRSTFTFRFESTGSDPLLIATNYTNYNFRLFSDFTFFARDSVRGDMIEQTDSRSIIGLKAEKQIRWSASQDMFFSSRVGVNFRADNIEVGLYEDSARQRYNTRVHSSIEQRQIGPYFEQEIITPFADLQLGVRADYVNYNVIDHTERAAQPSGVAQQFLVSPKANLSVPVSKELRAFVNAGFGFHSNDARAVVQDHRTSLPRAFGSEIGARYATGDRVLTASAALWLLDLEEELVYVGDEGTTEISGSTRRQGLDVELDIRPLDWLTVSSSMTLSRGRFIGSPEGENFIPLAPDLMLSSSLLAQFEPLAAGLHLRMVGDRPANESGSVTAEGHVVLDLTARYTFGGYTIYGEVDNLLNVDWNEAQFDTESRLRNEPASVSELHFTPGTPRVFKLGVGYGF